MNMPMGGPELVRKLKAKFGSALFVAVLSGDDIETVREACAGAGADDVIVKPISPSELRRRLIAAAPAGKRLPVAS